MKLKVQQVMEVLPLVTVIIRANRPMPQKGKYRLACLHAKLTPEFLTINAQRDELIKVYNFHQKIPAPHGIQIEGQPMEMVDGPEYTVPEDKMPEFTAAWLKIAEEEIDINVEPIPLEQLDLGDQVDGSITAQELSILGDLVKG